MFHWFRAVIDRIRALLAMAAGKEPEADVVAHHADHQSQLLRLAEMLEAEELQELAQELRQQAAALSRKQTMAGVDHSLVYWHDSDLHPALPAPPRKRIASVAQPVSSQAGAQ